MEEKEENKEVNTNAKEEVKKVENKQETKKEEKAENKTEVKKENEKTKNSKLRMFLVLAVLILALLVGGIAFRGSYLEMLEIGENYIDVYNQNLNYLLKTYAANFGVIFLTILITNMKIKSGLKVFFEQEKKQMPKLVNKSVAFTVAVIVSLVITKPLLNGILLFFNATKFGMNDPVFGLDIGFFMFQRPFIEMVLQYLFILFVGVAVYTAGYYIIVFNKYFDGIDRDTLKDSKLIKELFKIVKVLGIVLAGIVLIKTYNIGTEKFLTLAKVENTEKYSLYGAGFEQKVVKLWGYRIASLLIVVSVFRAVKYFKKLNSRQVIISIAIVPAYLVCLLVTLVIVKLAYVKPNELDKEKTDIEANIKGTQDAYAISIDENNIAEGGSTVTQQQITDNKDVIDNVAVVSENVLLSELNSSLTYKKYYKYDDSTLGQYDVNGENKLVYVTPREIVSNTSTRTYNNKTYEYTHGYSAIVTSATGVNEKGNLENIQKSFDDNQEALKIKQPRIYFGRNTNSIVVTNSKKNSEFDYPLTDSTNAENATYTYDGKAGLKLNFLDRLVLALKEGNIKLAFSGGINKESKILTNRNVIQRARTVMPYLTYDESPYMVVSSEGKLVWVLDAYTTSNSYPYSQKTKITINGREQEIDYIRNSVKVLVDAYDGTVEFYITDRSDPIALAYSKVYPKLFVDKDVEISTDISKHFIYPEYLYNIQAEVLKRYHSVQADVLYRNDDVWDIATYATGTSSKAGVEMEPYSTLVKGKNGQEQIGMILPYTLQNKQNLISYLIGTCENGKYKLQINRFSEDNNVLGPIQLDTQLVQDTTIAKEIEGLNVSGTKLVKNIIIVPVDNTILYVEPIYQMYLNEKDALPTLKKVVVASGNKAAIGNDLKTALQNLLSQDAYDIEVESTDTVEDLIDAIIKANANLENSSSSNDWEMTGKDLAKLQKLIEKLKIVQEKEKSNKKNNKNEDDSKILDSIFNREDANKVENTSNEMVNVFSENVTE